jgi:hypothetical protein
MADHKQRDAEHRVEQHNRTLKMMGYAAATAFCAVSVWSNLRYGLSLGKTPMDKGTYAVASVAADGFKVAAPLMALNLWGKRFHILALLGFGLWFGCVSWSMGSAVGFVLSSRGEAVAERAAEAATRHGWEAKVERAETQLATLGRHRPVDVIKAELASLVVPPSTWRRSRQCLDLSLEESRVACGPVLGLRKELAAADAADRLETQLVAGRAQLATVPMAGFIADPQASALARLIGAEEATIRTGVAFLLAGLIEAGSALGFTLVAVATPRNPPPRAPKRVPGPADKARRRQRTGQRWARSDTLERWVQARLKVDAAGSIPAREAYADFCRWARAAGIEPSTETRFGRDFSATIVELGGAKVKRRDRAYYDGVSLVMDGDGIEAPAPLRA